MLDGLRRDHVRADTMPLLNEFRGRATWFDAHRSMAPSVTRVCASTFATGHYPAAHGLEGNTLALKSGDRFGVHDAGRPDFLSLRRSVTGRALDRPSLAERLKSAGGAIVLSNVSPGAAYVHDPDHHGHVYHRAGSFAPAGHPIAAENALQIGDDLAGDGAMTDRFVADALVANVLVRQPAFALLWLGHPDTTQHAVPLGSPEHLTALNAADDHVGRVISAIDSLRRSGDEVLLLVGSDHGHQTVHAIVDVEAEIRHIGFGAAIDTGSIVIVPNGTACLVYATEDGASVVPSLAERLSEQSWAGVVVASGDLATIGQTSQRGLALFISMASDDEPNAYGVPGRSFAAKPLFGKPDRLGCGQHGGLGAYEQSPVLMIDGPGFAPGTTRTQQTSLVDIAPTILSFLGQPSDGMDGAALQSESAS
jgi:hypothetical protein